MAKVSVTIVNKLKDSYVKLINKKYQKTIVDINTVIEEKKKDIRNQIADDIEDFIKVKYPNVVVEIKSYNYYNEIKIGIEPITEEIDELKEQVKMLNEKRIEKTDELDLWEIEALKAGLEENIPTFDV